MKRYPLTTAFLILLGICAVFFALVLALGYLGDEYPYGLGGEKIGIIKIEGTIVESESTIEKIVKYRKNSGIKAIILRINSPGGVVAPPQEIYQEVGGISRRLGWILHCLRRGYDCVQSGLAGGKHRGDDSH